MLFVFYLRSIRQHKYIRFVGKAISGRSATNCSLYCSESLNCIGFLWDANSQDTHWVV
jgi:hypothetical protein